MLVLITIRLTGHYEVVKISATIVDIDAPLGP